MLSADHEHEVEQLGADRADEPLGEGVSLWGANGVKGTEPPIAT
jgi:hypothetical protein